MNYDVKRFTETALATRRQFPIEMRRSYDAGLIDALDCYEKAVGQLAIAEDAQFLLALNVRLVEVLETRHKIQDNEYYDLGVKTFGGLYHALQIPRDEEVVAAIKKDYVGASKIEV